MGQLSLAILSEKVNKNLIGGNTVYFWHMKNIFIAGAVVFSLLGALALGGAVYFLDRDLESPNVDRASVLADHQIQVNPDGSFTPERLVIAEGETVEWLLNNRQDAIVAATGTGRGESCPAPAPVELGAANDFTGPVPSHASGIFTLNLRGPGFVEEQVGPDNRCSNGEINPFAVGGTTLCKVGEFNATMEQTWADPALAGVFVRSEWNDIQPRPGLADSSFDFTNLDRELNAAVAHGKLVTINVVAGSKGTPEWLFTDGGVAPLTFQDKTNEGAITEEAKAACGPTFTLGDPTDEAYQEHYYAMIRKLGEHIRSRSDWYRAVAYVKLSGANMHTEELDLPSRCEPGCICNTEVWAKAGYTPDGLEDFFANQMDVWQEAFPGKPMIFALIQDGWPRVSNDGAYLVDGKETVGGKVPGPFEQTEALLAMGGERYPDLFVTAHNGLQPKSEGRPNPWVLEVQELGRPTSYQTTNLKKVEEHTDLQGVLETLWEQSEAFYLEIYEQVAWDARQQPGGILVPENQAKDANTLLEWDALLEERRNQSQFGEGEIYPDSHTFTFNGQSGDEFYFYNPSTCNDGTAEQKYGVIEIE
jgi:hypothetical protein